MDFKEGQKVKIVFGKVKSLVIMNRCGGKVLTVQKRKEGSLGLHTTYNLVDGKGNLIMSPYDTKKPFTFIAAELMSA